MTKKKPKKKSKSVVKAKSAKRAPVRKPVARKRRIPAAPLPASRPPVLGTAGGGMPKYTAEGILKNPEAGDKYSPEGVMKARA